ncbi:MAG: CBS domain-containing protein [Myxococcota bacterium]
MTPDTVASFMTPNPVTIERDQPLSAASFLMRENGIRHLPVTDGEHVVGLVSERDLSLVLNFKDVDPEESPVEEAMTEAPYVVRPDTPLHEVARTMAENRFGSALVMDGDQLVGVFTTVDALRVLERMTASGPH